MLPAGLRDNQRQRPAPKLEAKGKGNSQLSTWCQMILYLGTAGFLRAILRSMCSSPKWPYTGSTRVPMSHMKSKILTTAHKPLLPPIPRHTISLRLTDPALQASSPLPCAPFSCFIFSYYAYSVSPLCKLPKGKLLCLFYSLLYPKHLQQCGAQSSLFTT